MTMTTDKLKPAVPLRYKPYAPENKFLSKAEVIRRKRIASEKEAMMKAAEAKIEAELAEKHAQDNLECPPEPQEKETDVIPGNQAAPVVEKKKAGRPKKIEQVALDTFESNGC